MPDTRDPIVVTGMGAVSAFGWSVSALWEGLRSGRHAVGTLSRFDPSPHRTKIAAEVPEPERDLPRSARAERHSWADRFAIAAAVEALEQAGLPVGRLGPRAGVWFGSSTGGMYEGEVFYEAAIRSGMKKFPIAWLAAQQYNGPGDAVARRLGVEGPVETVSSACASGAMALGVALAALRGGEADVALAGASDSLCKVTYGGFNALRSVDPEPCTPFRARRQGLTIGEGAAVVILERLSHARARGATPLAELCGAAWSCDAHHMTAPEPAGDGAARALRAALDDAGLGSEAIDFVNAHGTGTPLNDAAEGRCLAAVFGDRVGSLPVTSTKALVGHLLGAAGALEAIATILCLRHGEVHPMPEAGPPDPEIALDIVVGTPRRIPEARFAASINLAFGGANGALVIGRMPEAA